MGRLDLPFDLAAFDWKPGSLDLDLVVLAPFDLGLDPSGPGSAVAGSTDLVPFVADPSDPGSSVADPFGFVPSDVGPSDLVLSVAGPFDLDPLVVGSFDLEPFVAPFAGSVVPCYSSVALVAYWVFAGSMETSAAAQHSTESSKKLRKVAKIFPPSNRFIL